MKNSLFFLKAQYFAAFVILCLMVSGCVTKQNGRVIDKTQALDLHIKMALGYIDKGNREAGRLHLKKAFDIDKNSPAAIGAMAQLYILEGEPVLAEEQFKLALKRDKNLTEVHNNYGIFLFNQKRYEESYAEFEKAAADLAYLGRAQTLTNVGRVALKLGNVTRAQAAFEHATILDKTVPDAYIELADIYFQKEAYADAKKNLDLYNTIGQESARSLFLGIRLENVFGNKEKEERLANQLKNRFPYSNEHLQYKQHNLN
ncbi:MAG TPA: type IV pilus biogenesis/stability protein PilW [Cellvibrio sp.]|nr:type IV pilus biogenesis/stability protein PilW [Cellvibrio sp.]